VAGDVLTGDVERTGEVDLTGDEGLTACGDGGFAATGDAGAAAGGGAATSGSAFAATAGAEAGAETGAGGDSETGVATAGASGICAVAGGMGAEGVGGAGDSGAAGGAGAAGAAGAAAAGTAAAAAATGAAASSSSMTSMKSYASAKWYHVDPGHEHIPSGSRPCARRPSTRRQASPRRPPTDLLREFCCKLCSRMAEWVWTTQCLTRLQGAVQQTSRRGVPVLGPLGAQHCDVGEEHSRLILHEGKVGRVWRLVLEAAVSDGSGAPRRAAMSTPMTQRCREGHSHCPGEVRVRHPRRFGGVLGVAGSRIKWCRMGKRVEENGRELRERMRMMSDASVGGL
jgi:hypothetical protein